MRESRRPRIILGVLLLIAFSFIAIDLRADANGPLGGVKKITGSVLGPMENTASSVTSPVRGFVDNLTSGGSKDEQIATLEAEIQRLRDSGASGDSQHRMSELNDLLRMSAVGQYRVVPAQVIGIGSSQGFARTVTLDVGQRDGISADMTVLASGGLAGRVVAVSSTSCVVVLLVDATASVGGRLEGAGEIGFVSGTGNESELEFQLLDPYGPLKAGDRIVTFGSKAGKPYVPGVPIGEVTEVSGTPGQLTRLAKVKPFVNVSTLDIVAVVVEPPRDNPRDSVLVPLPEPTSSATPSASAAIPVPSGSPAPRASASAAAKPTASATPTPKATPSPSAKPTGDGASPAASAR
ncbi:MAG: rod shape-determining protein MreC [Actinomycetes bacterium]